MAKLLDKLVKTTSAKLAVINWLLDSMPRLTKEVSLDRLVARHLPQKSIKYRPYQKNPKVPW